MKETNFLLTFRIEGVGLCAFVAIAPSTGEAKIVESENPTFATRPDVFDVHLRATDFLRCPAVFTRELSTLRNVRSHRGRDRRHLFWLISHF
jgi:hypothetical protein